MKIRVVSDIHQEFSDLYRKPWYNIEPLEDDKDTVLLLAGDIFAFADDHTTKLYDPADLTSSKRKWCLDLAKRFKAVCYVLGNHEWYGCDLVHDQYRIYHELDRIKNFYVMNQRMVRIDGVSIIGATLWSSMNNSNPLVMNACQRNLNDYRVISFAGKKLIPEHTIKQFHSDKHYIFEMANREVAAGHKVVVMTHHAPCELSIMEKYRGDPCNGGFASDLSNEILDSKISLWAHGHMHDGFDYIVGNTIVVCNPYGYVPNELNQRFKPTLTIEV